MTSVAPAEARSSAARGARRHPARSVVGGFYLFTGGVHLGIVAAGTGFYRDFADQALFPFVRDRWADVFMPHAVFWGLCLMLGETTLGILLFLGGRWAKVGWVGVIAFNALLVLFGWGFLLWSVPAVGILTFLAVRDWPRLSTGGRS
jgi:hypothetical protein